MSRESYSKSESYIVQNFAAEDAILKAVAERLRKDGKYGINVSPVEGKLLQWLVGLVAPKFVVEIGALYGYSTIWMARASPPQSKMISIEFDPKHAEIAREHVRMSGLDDRVEVRQGDAKTITKKLDIRPDMVFIDADKPGYKQYLDWAMAAIRVGGLIIGDNTFLFGHLIGEDRGEKTSVAAIESMRAFNETLAQSQNFRSTMIPTYEGMTVAQRIS